MKTKKAAMEMEQFFKIVIWTVVFAMLIFGATLVIKRLTGG